MIVDYSNNYAYNKNQTLQNELKCFLGISLLSGYNKVTEYGLGASVIISCANNLLTHFIAPYHLVFDNFFTCLPLLEKLSEMDLYGTGTIR